MLNLKGLKPNSEKGHSHDNDHNHGSQESIWKFKTYLPAIFSFVLLIVGIGSVSYTHLTLPTSDLV